MSQLPYPSEFAELTVKARSDGFGAEITGVDLSRPLPPQVLGRVKRAFADHAVVWFPGQPLTHDQLEAFTLQFGAFGANPFVAALEDHAQVVEVRREPDEDVAPFGGGWHSDWSFEERPPAATILHAKIVPPTGGETLFADCQRAYAELSAPQKRLLRDLRAHHSAAGPYGADGFFAHEQGRRSMKILPSAEADRSRSHPIVRRHPVTGRDGLFISPGYTVAIEGMADAESAGLLKQLFDHMLQDRFVYKHTWSADMLTMWDNRCVIHCALDGYRGHRRVMHRTVVAGERPAAAL